MLHGFTHLRIKHEPKVSIAGAPQSRRHPKFVAKLASHRYGAANGNHHSPGHDYKGYIEFLNSNDAVTLSPGAWDSVARHGSFESEGDDRGNDTEAEEVKAMITDLQKTNSELQAEMERLVGGLADLLSNIKHSSKSDKALHQALHQSSATTTTSNGQHHHPASTAPPPIEDKNNNNKNISCVMQHPGALCCTRSSIQDDPSSRSITISLETTAKATDDATARNLLTDEELGGLAAQALVSAAAELLSSRTRDINAHARPEVEKARHDELCAILQSGEILDAKANPVVSQFGHESYIMHLRDEVTGRRLKALFKPRVEGDADGWHRVPMEWVAYRLNLMLGMDYVPPVAYRTGGITFNVADQDNKEVSYAEGAMLYFTEDAHQLRCFPEAQWGTPPEPKDLLLSNTRVLDTLLHNSDRHHGHFLLSRHWCRGAWSGDRWVGEMGPCLIDHAASFRADAEVTMTHENAFRTGPVGCVAAETYLRLRFLDFSALAAEFRGWLTEEELRGMVRRRDAILKYLDGLVAEQGYASTVVEGGSRRAHKHHHA